MTPPPIPTPQPAWQAFAAWPHQAPAEAAQDLLDMHLAHTLEHGPASLWQGWQAHRLGEMLQWLNPSPVWREWLKPLAAGGAWHALPAMRRADYRSLIERAPARVPASFGRLSDNMTSGSSGVALRFQMSALALRVNRNLFHADHRRQGRDVHATMSVLSNQPAPPPHPHLDVPGNPWRYAGLQRVRQSPDFSVEENARWLCAHPARYLVTYPTLLSGMLSVIEMQGLAAPAIDQVITFAETVEPALRERVRRQLGARITDRYSCEEIGPIAFQCPRSDEHQHVAVTNALVEVADPEGRPLPYGEQGSVLVTGLHQWANPVLRYELGDVGTLLPRCPACGVQVPTLTRLLGRRRVLIERPNGELLYLRITAKDWLGAVPALREWRMVQTTTLDFRVEFVASHPLDEAEQAALRAMLAERVGPEFQFELVPMEAIVWPPGRKRQEILGLAATRPAE